MRRPNEYKSGVSCQRSLPPTCCFPITSSGLGTSCAAAHTPTAATGLIVRGFGAGSVATSSARALDAHSAKQATNAARSFARSLMTEGPRALDSGSRKQATRLPGPAQSDGSKASAGGHCASAREWGDLRFPNAPRSAADCLAQSTPAQACASNSLPESQTPSACPSELQLLLVHSWPEPHGSPLAFFAWHCKFSSQ